MIPSFLISHSWIHFILLIIYLIVALDVVCWFRMCDAMDWKVVLLLNNADFISALE